MLARIIINAVIILILAQVMPGVYVTGLTTALITAVVFAVVNATIRPLLILLTLPVHVITLGISLLIINALLVLLVSSIVPGFQVDGFWRAFLFSIVLSLIGLAIP